MFCVTFHSIITLFFFIPIVSKVVSNYKLLLMNNKEKMKAITHLFKCNTSHTEYNYAWRNFFKRRRTGGRGGTIPLAEGKKILKEGIIHWLSPPLSSFNITAHIHPIPPLDTSSHWVNHPKVLGEILCFQMEFIQWWHKLHHFLLSDEIQFMEQ
jgi:hypothetical protein